MDPATFLRIVFAQAILAAITAALENIVHLPYFHYWGMFVAAALNAIAAWVRANFPVARRQQGERPPLLARIF